MKQKSTIQIKLPAGLPAFLVGWKPFVDNLDIDEVRQTLKEDFRHVLLELKQKRRATVLKYEETPNYSSEQFAELKAKGMKPEYISFYRIMPPVRVFFEDNE